MTPQQADEINARVLGTLARPGLEPLSCPAGDGPWRMCREHLTPRHEELVRHLAHAPEAGALFPRCAILVPVIGTMPMAQGEGALVDRVARRLSVPEHPSTCSSAPGDCWHGQVWHKGRSGRLGPCEVPECQCAAFVRQ